jgi:membrane associated rhomboid family serine protease
MLYLWIFGDNVEDRLGHGRFLFFYVGCGLVAALTQVALSPDSAVPTVGASGAIAGVLGAYLISFPRSRVVTIIPIIIFPWIVEIPAVAYLVIWFAMQLLSGVASLGQSEMLGGVAWWAHIGGFVAGLVSVGILAPRRLTQVA